jgi:hypothetical protein
MKIFIICIFIFNVLFSSDIFPVCKEYKDLKYTLTKNNAPSSILKITDHNGTLYQVEVLNNENIKNNERIQCKDLNFDKVPEIIINTTFGKDESYEILSYSSNRLKPFTPHFLSHFELKNRQIIEYTYKEDGFTPIYKIYCLEGKIFNLCKTKQALTKPTQYKKVLHQASGLKITDQGIVDIKSKKILNKNINDSTSIYSFFIWDEKHYPLGIYKETRLASSQAQCYAPLHKNNENIKIYNIYCFDREIVKQKTKPVFYIYHLDGVVLEKFDFDGPDSIEYTYGKIHNKKMIFKNIPIQNHKNIYLNIQCSVPGNNFFSANFNDFVCSINDLKTLEKILKNSSGDYSKYIDLVLLRGLLSLTKLTFETLTPYNNIAYYLQKAGANEEAAYLLEKIITKFPNRTVAYYNLGDAYWALGEKKKAIKAYTTYIEQMCHKGLQKKIPKEVLERVKDKR